MATASDNGAHDLQALLSSPTRDFLVRNNGDQVKVSELNGKIVGLYFAASWSPQDHQEFTLHLIDIYKKLKNNRERFEVVFITLDGEEEAFEKIFKEMPWLAIPCRDQTLNDLVTYFDISGIPTLIIMGPDGKTLHSNAIELVEELGVQAYPFNPEKSVAMEEMKEAKLETQTLESILVQVSELVGENILLYFSAKWCAPCRAFLPKLINAYHEIKAKDGAFEVIFISSDQDESSFQEFFSEMPWLALPFGDNRMAFLKKTFKIRSIPSLIAIGANGKTVTDDYKSLLVTYGANAYPFTRERVKELEEEIEKTAEGWPQKVKFALHVEHELVLSLRVDYTCDACNELGGGWSYYCEECDYDLHPMCALHPEKNTKAEETNLGDASDERSLKGWVCEGGVCTKI
ncbi:protein-disulfide reductase [Ranunculus cassubicifolius]